MENVTELTAKKLKEINTNEKFRNEVAHAHGCYTAYPNSTFKYKKTCSYPVSYIVNEEQIQQAKDLKVIATKKVLKDNKNKLLFAGMGMTYTKEEHNDDILNHRIRTEFETNDGRIVFVEFGTMADYKTIRCDFSINRTKQAFFNDDTNKQSEFYNYKGLEKDSCLGKYNKANILRLINTTFNCSFKEMIVDNYNVSCEGVICESPKK